MEALIELDKALFTLINGQWHIPLADQILPYWREKTTWIPLYLLLAIWLVRRFKWQALWIMLGAGLVIACADQLSSSIIKPAVDRLRPCAEPGLNARLLLDSCGGRSFTSSHATNHFAIFVFFASFFKNHIRFIRPLGFFWAASISYAQVYVGVHYPADVIAGGLLGCLIGWLIYKLILALDANINSRRLSTLLS